MSDSTKVENKVKDIEKDVKDTAKETHTIEKNNSWLKTFIWVMIGVIVGILLSYAVFVASLGDTAKEAKDSKETIETSSVESYDNLSEDETSVSSSSITTYAYKHKVLSGEEKQEAIEKISLALADISKNNNFIVVETGENQFENYVYNKNNECFARNYLFTDDSLNDYSSSYSAIFRNDNKTVKVNHTDELVAVGDDLDLMSVVSNVVTAAKETDKVDLLEMTLEDEDNTEYRLDVNGEDAVKLLYNTYGDEFATNIVNKMKQQMGDDWEPHFIYVIGINKDNSIPPYMSCYSIVDNTEYLAWQLVQALRIDSWKLDDVWYTYDFENATLEDVTEMLNSLDTEISDILYNLYADEVVSENEINLDE